MDELGLSIARLAARAGMDYHVLYRGHRYKYMPSDTNLEKISKALEADIKKLLKFRDLDHKSKEHWKHRKKRSKKIVICELCLKPGRTTNAGITKYPHKRCRKDAKRLLQNGNKLEESKILTRFTSINQNKILLENKKKRKKRICLRCDKLFTSRGPQERICPYCHWYRDKVDHVEPLYRPHKVYA